MMFGALQGVYNACTGMQQVPSWRGRLPPPPPWPEQTCGADLHGAYRLACNLGNITILLVGGPLPGAAPVPILRHASAGLHGGDARFLPLLDARGCSEPATVKKKKKKKETPKAWPRVPQAIHREERGFKGPGSRVPIRP